MEARRQASETKIQEKRNPLETRRHKQMRHQLPPCASRSGRGVGRGSPAPVPPQSCPGEAGGEVQTLGPHRTSPHSWGPGTAF